nr:hypothetical protein [Nostoc sp. EkiNYC01]
FFSDDTEVQICRANLEDAVEGSWPDGGPFVKGTLDDIERWVMDRGGWFRRTITSIEWVPPSPAVEFEAWVRWR